MIVDPPINPQNSYADILRECADIADQRGEEYGAVLDNFSDAQNILKARYGIEMKMSTMAKVLNSFKSSRQKHKHKRDNIIDDINYMAIDLFLMEFESGKN